MSSNSRQQNRQHDIKEHRPATPSNSKEMLARWDTVRLFGTYSQEMLDKWNEINALNNSGAVPAANQKAKELKTASSVVGSVA